VTPKLSFATTFPQLLLVEPSHQYISQWHLAKTTPKFLRPLWRNIRQQRTKKKEKQFWETRPMLWRRVMIFARTKQSTSPKTCKEFVYFKFLFFYWFLWIQAIGRYIKGLIQKETSKDSDVPKPKKSKQKYNIRDVIRQLYRDRIEEEIPYDSNDPRHLGAYQKAVSTVHANMTEDELDEAGRTLESWHQEGVPRNMQVKWVLKFLTSCYAK